jgi:RNA polymerase sigma-70 factor (ECF subfamily)
MGSAARTRAAAEPPPDAEVVERAKGGDRNAFGILVQRYQGRAYRLALRVLRDEELARDVVQDAFLKAYGSLDRFEGRSSFYTWLYRVVMNLCLDSKRRDRSGRHVEWSEEHTLEAAPAPPGASSAAENGDTPALRLERKEIREVMAQAIDALPEDARRTLQLREIDGLSYAEIAEGLGIPKGTVMSRLHYARRRLRLILEEMGADDLAPRDGANDAEDAT